MGSQVSHENAQFSLPLSDIVFFFVHMFLQCSLSAPTLMPPFSQSPWGKKRHRLWHTDPAVRRVPSFSRTPTSRRRVFSRIVLRVELQSVVVVVGRARFRVEDEVSQSECIEEVWNKARVRFCWGEIIPLSAVGKSVVVQKYRNLVVLVRSCRQKFGRRFIFSPWNPSKPWRSRSVRSSVPLVRHPAPPSIDSAREPAEKVTNIATNGWVMFSGFTGTYGSGGTFLKVQVKEF